LGKNWILLIIPISKKEKVKRMLTHVTSGANISLTDRFFRKIGAKTLGGNYAFKL
jgi:hypothetical protein